jgi:histidine-containing phosphotransfer protein
MRSFQNLKREHGVLRQKLESYFQVIFLDQPARRASSLGTIPFITLLAFLACVQLLRQAGHAVSVTATRPRGM